MSLSITIRREVLSAPFHRILPTSFRSRMSSGTYLEAFDPSDVQVGSFIKLDTVCHESARSTVHKATPLLGHCL